MDEKVRNIIETAQEFIGVTKKAREQGIIGITCFDEAHIYDAKDFKAIAAVAEQRPVEKKRSSDDYPYEYVVKVDGIKFIHLSEEPLHFKSSDMEIVEEIKL